MVNNFFEAGYDTVVAGSFLGDNQGYDYFRPMLKYENKIFVVMLAATKPVRDVRRIERSKPTKKEWRDFMDTQYPPDQTLKASAKNGDYTFIEIENSDMSVDEVLKIIMELAPDAFHEVPPMD